MHVNTILSFVLCNILFGAVFARTGMLGDETDGELPPLQNKNMERVPKEGVIEYDDIDDTTLECKLEDGKGDEEEDGKEPVVKDTEWKWAILEMSDETDEMVEVILDGQFGSTLAAADLKDAVADKTGWMKLKCSFKENFAEFRVNAGNGTKGPKLSFRVKAFDQSKNVVEKEDFTVFCEIVNRTQLEEGETIEQGVERIKQELNVKWYRWDGVDDHTYAPAEGVIQQNCTEELMAGTKWKPMKTSELQKGDIDPHIKMINKSETKDDGKTWGFKIEDAINDDRRAYKCVVYNISEPRNCSESVFFLRVKDKYAALWPFIGIVAEVIVLCIVIFLCEHGKSSKDEFEDEGLNGNGVGIGGQQSGGGENSSIRQRRT